MAFRASVTVPACSACILRDTATVTSDLLIQNAHLLCRAYSHDLRFLRLLVLELQAREGETCGPEDMRTALLMGAGHDIS